MEPAKKQAIQVALISTVLMSGYFIWHGGLVHGLIQSVLAGTITGFILYFIYRSKKFNPGLLINIPNEENTIYMGVANHLKNGEWVGGKMALFTNELYFKSHRFNIQNHELQIPLSAITQVQPYNIAGIFRNGIEIKTSDGSTEKFVVYHRATWQMAILSAKTV
jgi:hypothetical protein